MRRIKPQFQYIDDIEKMLNLRIITIKEARVLLKIEEATKQEIGK